MTTEVDNVDDLEALLMGLEDDDMDLADLEGLEDGPVAEVKAEPVKPARKPRAPKAKVESVAESAPVAETYEGLTGDDDDLGDLSGLEDDLTEAAPAKPVAEPKVEVMVEDEDPLALADKIIALSLELTTAAVKHSDMTEEEVSEKLNAVIATISAGDKFSDIAKQMRDAVIAPDDEPFEVEKPAIERASRAAKDQVLEALANTPEPSPREEITQEALDRALLDAAGGNVEEAKMLGMVGEPVALEGDDDAEMEALLASSVDESADLATATAAPAGTAKAVSPKTIRPVFNPSGDLKTFIDPDRLQDDLNFSTNNISLAMTRQAALFAHYSNLSAQAAYQHDRAKQQVELLEANLDNKFRDSLTMAGTKFTETSLKSLITKDSSYQAAVTRAHEARAIAKMVDTAADSFRHRKDMLIQVGADLREEKKGKLVMKEHPGEAATRAMKGE